MEFVMTNEERWATLTAQHRQIRDTIAIVRRSALGLAAGRQSPLELRDLIAGLRLMMEVHLSTEETLLEPVLERLDAWGPVRLEVLRVDHVHQRALLADLSSKQTSEQPAERYAWRTLTMLEEILTDLDAEDRDLLDAKVLRDDCIQLDASDC
jgi:hemerythrin-like domain-containing protein